MSLLKLLTSNVLHVKRVPQNKLPSSLTNILKQGQILFTFLKRHSIELQLVVLFLKPVKLDNS